MISSVKIGGFIFKVAKDDNLEEKGGCVGSTLRGDKVIYLDSKRGDVSVLIHEMIHQAGWLQGVDLSEDTVVRIEFIINAILRDNPKLVELIQKEYHKK